MVLIAVHFRRCSNTHNVLIEQADIRLLSPIKRIFPVLRFTLFLLLSISSVAMASIAVDYCSNGLAPKAHKDLQQHLIELGINL